MNIFFLDENPVSCAEQHCDKHVVKMILEYAQLLSTAHRVLDGVEFNDRTSKGHKIKRWTLSGNRLEEILYKATHVNHPSNIWARTNKGNYEWLYSLYVALCNEYTHRYGKVHACDLKLREVLKHAPRNIPTGNFTHPPQAMPDNYRCSNTISAYRTFYIKDKASFCKWTNRNTPEWFK